MLVSARSLMCGKDSATAKSLFVDHTSGSQLGDAIQVAARPTTNGKGEM
jgi:hypothetical protein